MGQEKVKFHSFGAEFGRYFAVVIGVGKYQLNSVLPRRQVQGGLCLSLAEMQVLRVCWNRLSSGRQIGIDDNVMMSCAIMDSSGGRLYCESRGSHFHGQGRVYLRTVSQAQE
jgi:hypothetical protein